MVNVDFKVDVGHGGKDIWWVVKFRNQDVRKKVENNEQGQGMQTFSVRSQRVNTLFRL